MVLCTVALFFTISRFYRATARFLLRIDGIARRHVEILDQDARPGQMRPNCVPFTANFQLGRGRNIRGGPMGRLSVGAKFRSLRA